MVVVGCDVISGGRDVFGGDRDVIGGGRDVIGGGCDVTGCEPTSAEILFGLASDLEGCLVFFRGLDFSRDVFGQPSSVRW